MPKKAKNSNSNPKTVQSNFTIAQNQGINEKINKILSDPDNFTIPDSVFDLKSKSSIVSQALTIGLDYLLDHPKQPRQSATSLELSTQIANMLFAKLDARLKTLFETQIANYLNEKETNLLVRNLSQAFKDKLPASALTSSINKLDSSINPNIDLLLEDLKKQLLKKFDIKQEK